jgi:hypothetical protein
MFATPKGKPIFRILLDSGEDINIMLFKSASVEILWAEKSVS